ADDASFQRSAIDLETFYEGSRLADLYTKEEFDTFVLELHCPRCDEQLGANIWPYSFPFDLDDNVEQYIHEIGQLAQQTPFLLLKHQFATKTYETVASVASSLAPMRFSEPLYRARTLPVKRTLAQFDLPPQSVVKEGRYNHAGNPVLYLASDPKTCFEEMRRTHCIVAELSIERRLTVLDLVHPDDSHPEHSDVLRSLAYSALMSAKQPDNGWHKPAYVFSRFVADCARASGIQAIKYPSTRIAHGNYNLVIVDPNLRLETFAEVSGYSEMTPGSTRWARASQSITQWKLCIQNGLCNVINSRSRRN
ncbi:MAG: RES domain-containing protein, partial [Planctomycetaceae bacterium]